MAKYEGSAADKAHDAKAAKKAGMTAAKWEGSAADMRADKAGQKALDRKRKPRNT